MTDIALIATGLMILAAYLAKARLWITPALFGYFVATNIWCGIFALGYQAILAMPFLPAYLKELFLNPLSGYFLFGVPSGLLVARVVYARRYERIVLLGCTDVCVKEMVKEKFLPSVALGKPITDLRALPYVVVAGSTLISIALWYMFLTAIWRIE